MLENAASAGRQPHAYIAMSFRCIGLLAAEIHKTLPPSLCLQSCTPPWTGSVCQISQTIRIVVQLRRHCVIFGVESSSGVLEWSHGEEPWRGFLSGMNSDLELFLPFLGQDLVLFDPFLVNAYFNGALCTWLPLFLLPCVAHMQMNPHPA